MNKKINKKLKEELPLDDYERELAAFLKKGEFVSDPRFRETKKMLQEAAKNFLELQKTKRITLRVKNEDIIKVKAKAKRVNIPYQRLLNALIHKYAEGETSIRI